jgi:hypothetical protein
MILNGYASLPDFKAYGIANDVIDEADDAIIEKLITSASRYIDNKTGRKFYPRVETRYYDAVRDPILRLDEDLLEVIGLTNGEGTAIAAASYNLLPLNEYPKYAVHLIPSSNIYWMLDSNSNYEGVIDLEGFWGYHEFYGDAWKEISAVDEVLNVDATVTAFTLDSNADLLESGGQLLRIDDEIMRYEGKSLTEITVERGVNGSTAAIHLDDAPVYLWTIQEDIMNCCWDIVNGIYKRRTGENATSTSVLTSAGVIVTPKDISDFAAEIIGSYRDFR